MRVFVDTVTRAAAIEPPANGEQAQFSIGFSVALAFMEGNGSIFQYTDAKLADAAVRSMMERIDVGVDPALDARYPDERGRARRGRARRRAHGAPRRRQRARRAGMAAHRARRRGEVHGARRPRGWATAAQRVRDLVRILDDVEHLGQLAALLAPAEEEACLPRV